MKKFLILVILMLSQFSIKAEGVQLNCSSNQLICNNCPDYQTLFPAKDFSVGSTEIQVEADESEIREGKYLLSGNVEVSSESIYLFGDNIEVSSTDESIVANGNVKFQDSLYMIRSDSLSANKSEDGQFTATASNATFQDYSFGQGGANGYTKFIKKTPSSVLLTNTTYSLCPADKNDWFIEAGQINLDFNKNRGYANSTILKFYGIPILYTPKYSWVLSGRGSGFLTPDYYSYSERAKNKGAYGIRVPYYFNIAPDRDLQIALNYMTSRGLSYESKYRQLLAQKFSSDHENSIFSVEANYLPKDKITDLSRWLFKFSEELDLSENTHLSAQLYRVSDSKYFEEIARKNTDEKTLKSSIKYTYKDNDKDFSLAILTENEQIVNDGTPVYTKALEGSVSKTLNADQKIPIQLDLVSTRFAHDTATKESGTRTHGNLGISRKLNINYPKVTPRASVAITNYSLKNSPNINRTILGSGLDVDFTINNATNLFGYRVNHQVSPIISYNYRAKKVQGNIPLFDSTDKYDGIISFADLTSGERYTGFDRITNANDITLSLESTYREIDAAEDDKDLLSMKIAQTYFTDDEVVSDTANNNYETRKSYSDIAASIDLSIDKFTLSSAVQFSPDKSKIVKKENTISYSPSSRKFISLSFSDDGTDETEKFYGAYPITDSIHVFGGIDKIITSGITNTETTGIAYESCCWAFRLAHFKEDNSSNGYNYSTGMELVLTGLGSTTSPLKNKIEKRISGYTANLR